MDVNGGLVMTRRELVSRTIVAAAALHLPMPPQRERSVIMLRMDGGPSQCDTWVPTRDGFFGSIVTSAPGMRVCELMPRLAMRTHVCAVLANVRVPEINHRRARFLMRTGMPAAPSVVPELSDQPPPACGSGADADRLASRYGRSDFGRQCAVAFRRIARGERYAEAVLPGWDAHTDAAPQMRRLLADMDVAMAALLDDLMEHDLLRTTLVVWGGEFGRTEAVNRTGGRDHDPERSCFVLAGAGVRGGTIVDGPTPWTDVFATIASLSPMYGQRSRRVAAAGRPIKAIMA